MTPPAAAGPAVALADVRFAWRRGAGGFRLDVPGFAVDRGETLLLVGPSGSGKSTLLGLISGTLVAEAGSVEVLGADLGRLSGRARDQFRAEHVGVIFQMFNLLPYLSILDNVLLPLRFAPARRRRVEALGAPAAEARRLLEALGLDLSSLAGQASAELSVGQQQRVASARALIGAPEIIIADEPTSALDRDRQDAFLDLLFAEVSRARATLLMVSHEERFAGRFDRVVRLDELTRPAAYRPAALAAGVA